MITVVTLRMNLPLSAASPVEAVVFARFSSEGLAGWCISVLIKQDPGRECEDDRETRIDERRRAEVWLQVADLNNPVRDERQRQSADDADHPRWKIGAENIYCWRAVTENVHRKETDDQQRQDDNDKSQERATIFHRLGRLTSGGAGRARSPTLSASAA